MFFISLFTVHLLSTFAMAGIILFVHQVHYPLFAEVRPENFKTYHQKHVTQITPLVGGLILIELLSGIGLYLYSPSGVFAFLLLLTLAIWAITYWVGSHHHARLKAKFQSSTLKDLIRFNRVRTFLWVTRAGVLATLAILNAHFVLSLMS